MEEDDPGIPIRTAEMKDPETPPIQIASSRIKEVSVESPNVTGRRSAYNVLNEGAPAYRMTPRYNSEYMWNKPALRALKPIPALIHNAENDTDTYTNYHCSIPWFAYPGDMPESL